MKNSLSAIELPIAGTQCILALRLSTSAGCVTIISIYAPTLCSTPEVKDQFYEELYAAVGKAPEMENLLLLRDCNARVGGDQETWPDSLGQTRMARECLNSPHIAKFVYHQHVLRHKTTSLTVLDTPKVTPLSPAGLGHNEKSPVGKCTHHLHFQQW